MRIFPWVLIAVGVFQLLKHFGLIDPAFLQLAWPLLLIAIGVAMLARGPRWRAEMRERMHDRWERRLSRRFGPGWANLSDAERERFRAGMRQWRGPGHGCGDPSESHAATAPAGEGAPVSPPSSPPSPSSRPGEPR